MIHWCNDGHSHMVIYLAGVDNNQAATVLDLISSVMQFITLVYQAVLGVI